MAILRLDHVGIVARSWDEAREVLVNKFGFKTNSERPSGTLYDGQNTMNYGVSIGDGQTRIEILVPLDTVSGVGKFLVRRGPGLHHLGYVVDDIEEEAQRLIKNGMVEIPLGRMGLQQGPAFFYPKEAMGILTELVPLDRSQINRVVQEAAAASAAGSGA